MNRPVGPAHRAGNQAAHQAVQVVQQSNRANQALILRNQQRTRYFMVSQQSDQEIERPGHETGSQQGEPQADRRVVEPLGLELARRFVINEYKPIDGSVPFEVLIDGKQISFGLGDDRALGLLQALMDIAEQESDD
jgi:hypothetical protein